MPFQPGHKFGKGRKKGQKNKDSIPLEEKCKELGVDPFEILLHFASGNWKKLGYKSETKTIFGNNFSNEEYNIEPSIRSKAAAEACQYVYSKRKAIDVTHNHQEPLNIVWDFRYGDSDSDPKANPNHAASDEPTEADQEV